MGHEGCTLLKGQCEWCPWSHAEEYRRPGQSQHGYPRGSAEQIRPPGSSEQVLALQQSAQLSGAGGWLPATLITPN